MAEITRQVSAGSDDCFRGLDPDSWSLIALNHVVGAPYLTSRLKKRGGGLRFTNVTIPKGASITKANLIVTAYASYSDTTVNSRISAEKEDNPATFANDKAAFDTRWANRSTARVDWDGIPAFTTDTEYTSPDIKTVIQEIVNRAGWASGNALVIFWEDFEDRSVYSGSDNTRRDSYQYEGSTTKAAKLVIEYATVVNVSVSETLNLSDTPTETMRASVSRMDGIAASDTPYESMRAPVAQSELLSLADVPLAQMVAQLLRTDTAILDDLSWLLGQARLYEARIGTETEKSLASIKMTASPSRLDTLDLSDVATLKALLSMTEQLNLSDSSTVKMLAGLLRSDSLSLQDTPLAEMLARVLRSDTLTLTDEAIIALITAIRVLVSETLQLTDSRVADMKAEVLRADTLNLSDLPSCVMKALVEHSDTLTLSDAQNIAMLARLVRSETLNLQDNALVTMLAQVLRQETLTLEDIVLLSRIGMLVKLWLFTKTYHDLEVCTKTYHDVTIWTGDGDMTIRRDWHRGETVPVWAEVKLESTGALHDPDQGVLITAINSAGTKVLDAQAMTKSEVGKYVYYWNSPVDAILGWYRCSGKAQDGAGSTAKITIEHGGFALFE